MAETDWWECPVCHKRVTPDDHCEHVYFDSQVRYGPLLKRKYLKVTGLTVGQQLWEEAEHEQD